MVAGATFTNRLLPLPEKVMFASGTIKGLEELPVNVRFCAAVSRSPIVTGIRLETVSSSMVCAPMLEIEGGSLTDCTLRTKEFVVRAPSGSRTITLTDPVPMNNTSDSVDLNATTPSHYYLIWITSFAGHPGDYGVEIDDAKLYE